MCIEIIKEYMKQVQNYYIRLKFNLHSNIVIGNGSLVRYASINPNVKIGRQCNVQGGEYDSYTYLGNFCELPQTKVGKFCSIAGHVILAAGNHPVSYVSTSPYTYSRMANSLAIENRYKDEFYYIDEKKHYLCEIGNDVWIGTGALLVCSKKALKIGDGAIIAAGSVVIDDVPPYALVAGCPAKVVKYRFEKKEIEQLLKLKWWNKDEQWLKSNINKFAKIEEFLQMRC